MRWRSRAGGRASACRTCWKRCGSRTARRDVPGRIGTFFTRVGDPNLDQKTLNHCVREHEGTSRRLDHCVREHDGRLRGVWRGFGEVGGARYEGNAVPTRMWQGERVSRTRGCTRTRRPRARRTPRRGIPGWQYHRMPLERARTSGPPGWTRRRSRGSRRPRSERHTRGRRRRTCRDPPPRGRCMPRGSIRGRRPHRGLRCA